MAQRRKAVGHQLPWYQFNSSCNIKTEGELINTRLAQHSSFCHMYNSVPRCSICIDKIMIFCRRHVQVHFFQWKLLIFFIKFQVTSDKNVAFVVKFRLKMSIAVEKKSDTVETGSITQNVTHLLLLISRIRAKGWLILQVLVRTYTIPSLCHLHHAEPRTHYDDVIMSAIASRITNLTNVYLIVYSRADQRKHQSSASLAFVRGIHRKPVNSPHKGPVTRKIFPFDDVIMRQGIDCKITVTSQWARWRLKSPTSRLFVQPFIQAQIKQNIKALRHWPLWGEFTSHRCIPHIKGQWREKCFHLITS